MAAAAAVYPWTPCVSTFESTSMCGRMEFRSCATALTCSSVRPRRARRATCRTSSRLTVLGISVECRLQIGLRDDERLPPDALVIEIDLDLCFAPDAIELGDRPAAKLAMLHARSNRERRELLRLVLGSGGKPFDGRARAASCVLHREIRVVREGRGRLEHAATIAAAGAAVAVARAEYRRQHCAARAADLHRGTLVEHALGNGAEEARCPRSGQFSIP